MELRITKDQEVLVNELIAQGRIGSLEDVVSFALDQLRADATDVAWAKPFIDEALAEIQQGDPLEWDAKAFLDRMHGQAKKST